MTTFTEARHPGEFIIAEANGNRSREARKIKDGVAILAGQILGKVLADHGAVTVGAPAFTGTGDGVLTKATPAYGAGVQEGTYKARLVEAGANLGQFAVTRPDGTLDGYATVGAAYDGQVKFTIADGSADFAAAAQFTLAVTKADPTDVGLWAAYDPDGTDGGEVADEIAIYPLAATDTDRLIATIARDCTVNGKCLVWDADTTDLEKAAAIAKLAEKHIIVR